jgi:hypothetical protein
MREVHTLSFRRAVRPSAFAVILFFGEPVTTTPNDFSGGQLRDQPELVTVCHQFIPIITESALALIPVFTSSQVIWLLHQHLYYIINHRKRPYASGFVEDVVLIKK